MTTAYNSSAYDITVSRRVIDYRSMRGGRRRAVEWDIRYRYSGAIVSSSVGDTRSYQYICLRGVVRQTSATAAAAAAARSCDISRTSIVSRVGRFAYVARSRRGTGSLGHRVNGSSFTSGSPGHHFGVRPKFFSGFRKKCPKCKKYI